MKPLRRFLRELRAIFGETIQEWQEDNAMNVAASLAYYAIFSLSPLLIVLALVLGLVIGDNQAQNEVLSGVEDTLGEQSTTTVESALEQNNPDGNNGTFSILIWFGVVLWGVSGLFGQLQKALNIIWEVRLSKDAHRLVFLKNRLLSFSIVAIAGFLLVMSTIMNTALGQVEIDGLGGVGVRLFQVIVSIGIITTLFAAVYKILPDVIIEWRDVWVGACFTAILFLLGQLIVSFYISNSNVGSFSGAAGSLTIVLVWVYYSAQIFLFGAEFTEVWARHHGAHLRPDEDAEWINPQKAQQEIEDARKVREEIRKAFE